MTKYKLLLSVMLSIALVVTMSPILYASNNEIIADSGELTAVDESFSTDETINPRFTCLDCEWFTTFYCKGPRHVAESYDHKPLFKDTCHVICIVSVGSERCTVCNRDVYIYEGYHDCLHTHSVCDSVDMCPANS